MNRQTIDSRQILDTNQLDEIRAYGAEGRPDFLDRVIDMFQQQAPHVLFALRASAAAKNWRDTAFFARKLRLAAEDLGALKLREVCADIEYAAKERQIVRTQASLQSLPHVLHTLLIALKSERLLR